MNKLPIILFSICFAMLINLTCFQEVSASPKGDKAGVNSEILLCKFIGVELAEKKELVKKEIFSQVKEVEETDDGYIFSFVYSGDLYLKTTDYIIVEKDCCPFFNFDFSIPTKSKNFTLKISGSSEAKEMIKMFVEEIKKF
jgi:hypothetical protein